MIKVLLKLFKSGRGRCQWPTSRGICGKATDDAKRYCRQHL